MEPKNHPSVKEKHLNQTIIFRVHVNLPGCNLVYLEKNQLPTESVVKTVSPF